MLLAGLIALPGCAGSKPPNYIGELRVDGPDVRVNGRPARDGMEIYGGDDVATGGVSSAKLEFRDGGFVQLDENTDPRWVRTAASPNRCTLDMTADYGQFYAEPPDPQKCAFRVAMPALQADATGALNVESQRPPAAVVTVLKGETRLVEPRPVTVAASQRVAVSGTGVVQMRTASSVELAEAVAWRQRYEFSGGVSWGKVLLVVTVIGVVVGVILAATLDGGSGGKRDRPRPQPNPDTEKTPPREPTPDDSGPVVL